MVLLLVLLRRRRLAPLRLLLWWWVSIALLRRGRLLVAVLGPLLCQSCRLAEHMRCSRDTHCCW
jgi:hypothetical protein